MKQTVETIVAELAKGERICRIVCGVESRPTMKNAVGLSITNPNPDTRWRTNREFRDIKNAVLRSALLMLQSEQQEQSAAVIAYVGSLILQLAKTIAASCQNR